MRRGLPAAFAAAILVATLAGCASAGPGGGTQTPTPTAACPEQPGVELPPECAPYDPEQSMAQNDVYRQRMDIDAGTQAAGDALIAPVTAALEELRASGRPLEESDVAAALAEAGVDASPQLRSAAGDVLFGAAVGGGCVYGAVTPEAVTVQVGGFIMDGGCLPAQ